MSIYLRHALPAAAAITLTLAAAAHASAAPATVTATELRADKAPFLRAGAPVRSSQLSVRTLIDAKHGFALASVGQAQYPAATADGGKTWRIDGPHLHVNAANAPDAVASVGAVGPATYFAYAGPSGGQSVAVSTDAGEHWWRAYLPGVPLAVLADHVGGRAALVALVESNPAQFWAYVSTDGGKHWRYDRNTFV
jgi:hypothetical protein